MPVPEEETRPRAVTVIGWLWVVLGILFLFRALVNIVIWRMLRPDMLGFLESFGAVPPPLQRLLRPLFEHLTALQTAEAILSAAVIVIAIQLLRLRPWARVGMQLVCWLVILYSVSFGAFWFWIWRSGAMATPPGSSWGKIGLAVGLNASLTIAAGAAVMIALLARRRIREAFHRAAEP